MQVHPTPERLTNGNHPELAQAAPRLAGVRRDDIVSVTMATKRRRAAKSILKTVKTTESVSAFLANVQDPERRRDCRTVAAMMRRATGASPRMWGPSIVGFGDYHYKYETGREADWFEIGFSPRKGDLTLYVMGGIERHPELLRQLGKHSTGRSCLYIKRLAEVDLGVLDQVIREGVRDIRAYASEKRATK
jgi:hypothetical protein